MSTLLLGEEDDDGWCDEARCRFRCPRWRMYTAEHLVDEDPQQALSGLYLSFLWESFVLFLVFSMVFSLA